MSVLPSPVPHPLEFSPFDVPAWAYEALEWVVGFDWPAGNEVATWDVADRWFLLATSLAEPNEAAMSAAHRFLSGYGGAGITADGFENAWHLVAGDENAPLHDLLRVSGELGKLVEGCGADIEAAKLEAWIEIGIFLIELVGMAVTVAFTLGAASPAAGGLIVATRLAIQQIFKRLVEQLGTKALKQTAGRTVKQLAAREGRRKLARQALGEGFDEAREEIATNGGIQLYQQSTGRSDGFDADNLGRAALAGFAGGAASSGSQIGSHGHGGVLRGAGGEVMAEFGAAATFGQLPDAAGLAKSATSGAAGSAVHGLSTVDVSHLSQLDGDLVALGGGSAFGSTTVGVDLFGGGAVDIGSPASTAPFPNADEAASLPTAAPTDPVDAPVQPTQAPTAHSPSIPAESPSPSGLSPSSPTDSPAQPSPRDSLTTPPPTDSLATPSPADSTVQSSPAGSPAPSSPVDSPATSQTSAPSATSPSTPSPAPAPAPLPQAPLNSSDGSSVLASTATVGFADSLTTAATAAPPQVASPITPTTSDPPTPGINPAGLVTPRMKSPASPATSSRSPAPGSLPPARGSRSPAPGSPFLASAPGARSTAASSPFPASAPGSRSPAPGARRSSLSDLERIADALGPRTVPRQPARRYCDPAVPDTTAPPRRTNAPRHASAPSPQPEVRDERAYFGYVEHARQTHEQNRRDEYATYLNAIAEDNRSKIVDLGFRADDAARLGFTLREAQYRRQARELSEIVAELDDQVTQVRSGELAPARVEVDPPEWARINADVGNLAPGGVRTGEGSALDGFTGRPPIDRTRHYNVVGGLRPPLAVHQIDIENAVPRDHSGNVSRLPDPREGTWFRLANDGGPAADPTRGLNCVDGVLALFDTYIHGRPRVSAPRTFDVYANGNPDRPLGGETQGIQRIRVATGGDFQSLCPHLGGSDPAQSQPAMDLAVQNLTNHLLNTGHGAYAFLVTDLEGGGSHSWAALNHHGTVLFVDPQIGRITENTPLYRHHGVPTPINIVSLEALVVDAAGTPTPLPHHGPGTWSAIPTGADHGGTQPAFATLTTDQQETLLASTAESHRVAARVSSDLHAVTSAVNQRTRLVDEQNRVKSAESLSRKFLEAFETENVDLDEFIRRVKDRVRFSVETPEDDYGATVVQVLAKLDELGYRRTGAASFWSDRGRHNGLNVWLTTPSGFRIEVQFPTPLSHTVGKKTHHSYEVLRLGHSAAYERVNAFLEILAINKRFDIYAHQPVDLHLITGVKTKESTLAAWFRADPATLAQYKKDLRTRGISLNDDLQRHGLGSDDVPGLDEMGLSA
ncbi:toxin glutamine deamidase domain-containing protein [Paractinoplanes maris]|uniref:toxin glutamine deamidase domain-containing protein n=1 Tax=Paractinoplanes maris TaxID=1734446 RepID=UPI00202100EC|nr:toxin glutamine deamidase domain-containing protein [Actinoplanes maris]